MSASGQPEPQYLEVRARWTSGRVSTDVPGRLRVSGVSADEVWVVPVSAENWAALAQHVGVSVDAGAARGRVEVWVGPRGGVDLLFPGEARRFSLYVRPLGEVRALLRVSVRGELGSEVVFEVAFESRFPALRLVGVED